MTSLLRQGNVLETPEVTAGQWHAFLSLRFAQTAHGCRMLHKAHDGPLYVQRPFYPEGPQLAHVYLLHPPGGMVSGDQLEVSVHLEQGAAVLLTTPGAARVYRARPDRTLQRLCNRLHVGAGASLEWLPQETIVFPDACTRLETFIELEEGAQYLGWEITSLGLPVGNHDFRQGSLQQRLQISSGGRLVLADNFMVDDLRRAVLSAASGLRDCPISGLLVAGLVQDGALGLALLESLRERIVCFGAHHSRLLAGVTLVNQCLVARYLGGSVEQARNLFVELWEILRPALMQRQVCVPRIWAT